MYCFEVKEDEDRVGLGLGNVKSSMTLRVSGT